MIKVETINAIHVSGIARHAKFTAPNTYSTFGYTRGMCGKPEQLQQYCGSSMQTRIPCSERERERERALAFL